MQENRPKIGVGVIVKKDGKVLIGKRKSSHGEGSWGFAGGHLEFKETINQCVEREVMEEAGINIKNIKSGPYTEDIHKKEDKHYVTLFVTCDYDSGEVQVCEKEKCERWEWVNWNNLPTPLFLPIQNLLKQNYNPFN